MKKLLALLLLLLASPAAAGTLYIDTGGALTNSGSTDTALATLSGATATDVTTTVTLPAGTDLSAVVTAAGPTQSSIYLTNSTVANRKIYWISGTSGSGGATPTVTVDTAPACTAGACGAWKIGGQSIYTSAAFEASLRPGDILLINNSPASKSGGAFLTMRVAGTAAGGYIYVKGKTGVRPVLQITDTNIVINAASLGSLWFENLELAQSGASGVALSGLGQSNVVNNVKVSDSGGNGMAVAGAATKIFNSEVTGVGGAGITTASALTLISGNYVHDNAVDGIDVTIAANSTAMITDNIVDTNAGRGIYISAAATSTSQFNLVSGNTVFGNLNSGLEIADADTQVQLLNNIFSNNGDAAGEYNVEWAAGTAELNSFHGWNVFYTTGGGGSDNVFGLTVNSQAPGTEFITDPQFKNATGGDFTINSTTSPAKSSGYPGVLLGGSTGYMDMGPLQKSGGGYIVGGTQ